MSKSRRKGIAIVHTNKGILVVAGRDKRFMLPGGGAGRAESRKHAAIRELYEETALKTSSIRYLFSYVGNKWHNHKNQVVRNHAKVFLVAAHGIPRPRHEIKHIAFWKPKSKLNISSGARVVLERYLEIKRKKNPYS